MSAEGKWTKGPLRAVPWNAPSFLGKPPGDTYEIQYGTDGECVAEIVHGKEYATLFAAAPDMAEALREIDSEAASKEPPTSRTSDDPDEAFHEGYVRGLWEAATRARAALAKGGA